MNATMKELNLVTRRLDHVTVFQMSLEPSVIHVKMAFMDLFPTVKVNFDD